MQLFSSDATISLLICTLISENQGLLQTLEKFWVLHTWIILQFVNWIFFQIYTINHEIGHNLKL